MTRRTQSGQKNEDLISRPTVARSFGVCCRTVQRWEITKGLTPYKLGPTLVSYPASQVERIREQARAAAQSVPVQA